MVTGIEVAGLALAIFPIIVQGFGFYLQGAQKNQRGEKALGHLETITSKARDEKSSFGIPASFFLIE